MNELPQQLLLEKMFTDRGGRTVYRIMSTDKQLGIIRMKHSDQVTDLSWAADAVTVDKVAPKQGELPLGNCHSDGTGE